VQITTTKMISSKIQQKYGYPIVIKTVLDRIKRLLTIAGLNEELTPHSLRHTHTFASCQDRCRTRTNHGQTWPYRWPNYEKCLSPYNARNEKEASQEFSQLMRSLQNYLYYVSILLAIYFKILIYQGFRGSSHHAAPKVRVCNILNILCK
jgi:hypothetical protein